MMPDFRRDAPHGDAPATWATRLAATLDELRVAEAEHLDAGIRALAEARDRALAELDERIRRLRARVGELGAPGLGPGLVPTTSDVGSVWLAGRVRLAGTSTPLPALRLRIVDAEGKVVAERAEWHTDAAGRFRVVLGREGLPMEPASLQAEFLDPAGAVVHRVRGLPVPLAGAQPMEIEIPEDRSEMLSALAAHGRVILEGVGRNEDELGSQMATLEAERAAIAAEFEQALSDARASRSSLEAVGRSRQ